MIFQFKVQLLNIDNPVVWRTIRVPAQSSFLRLHEVIQASFGWENKHLFQLSPAGFSDASDFEISIPESEDWDSGEVQDARKLKLSVIFTREGQELLYVYDFGDDWEHQIKLEKIEPGESQEADCLAGNGACPPEDCGGAWRYKELKAALIDPAHPEHEDAKEWMGMEEGVDWDPKAFDLVQAKVRVKSIS